jgi:hypothetical protein
VTVDSGRAFVRAVTSNTSASAPAAAITSVSRPASIVAKTTTAAATTTDPAA